MPAIEKMVMFFKRIVVTLLVRTEPASRQANPAAIQSTRNPCTRNEKVLKMKLVSAETAAFAGAEKPAIRSTEPKRSRNPFQGGLGKRADMESISVIPSFRISGCDLRIGALACSRN
jgi:hypothetical protein